MTNTETKKASATIGARKQVRRNVQAMCKIKVLAAESEEIFFDSAYAMLVDISQSGIRVEMINQVGNHFFNQRFPENAQVLLDLVVPRHQVESLHCSLRWVRATRGGCAIGLQTCASDSTIHRTWLKELQPRVFHLRDGIIGIMTMTALSVFAWGWQANNNMDHLQSQVDELQAYLHDSQLATEELKRTVEIADSKVAQSASEINRCRQSERRAERDSMLKNMPARMVNRINLPPANTLLRPVSPAVVAEDSEEVPKTITSPNNAAETVQRNFNKSRDSASQAASTRSLQNAKQ